MDLPPLLRARLDEALAGVNASELRTAADRLSSRYRGEVLDGRMHLDGDQAVLAYLAMRLPATYAAIRMSLDAVTAARPGFMPRTALDLGAGPGTALWALADCWPGLEQVTLIEQSQTARTWGERLSANAGLAKSEWITGDLSRARSQAASGLVILSYVLSEISEPKRGELVESIWQHAGDTLLIIEPGTSAGWARVMAVRTQLLELGADIVAPCPHHAPCPLSSPDWCHFATRVSRSRLHRQLKGGELGWEDEKFIYLAASRHAPDNTGPRIIARPNHAKGRVAMKLCMPDGQANETVISRRQAELYARASRANWGDTL